MGKGRFGLVRVLSKHSGEKCGIFDVKRRFNLAKVQLLLTKMKELYLNQVRSVAGSLQWVSQMCPLLMAFLAGLYAFFENKVLTEKIGNEPSITH